MMCCYIHIPHYNFILYTKTHWQWTIVEIHTVSNQNPKTLSWLWGKERVTLKDCQNIAIFIPSYSSINIILGYNFLLAKKDSRYILSSLFTDYFHSQRSIWVVAISLEQIRRKNCLIKMCCFISRNLGKKCLIFLVLEQIEKNIQNRKFK